MSDTITLPGDIPGLLRLQDRCVHTPTGKRCSVQDIDDGIGQALVLFDGFTIDVDEMNTGVMYAPEPCMMWVPLSCLSLDLTDATGRAHAAWWLATQEAQTAADTIDSPDFSAVAWYYYMEDDTGAGWWMLHTSWATLTFHDHECLEGLDDRDPRTLPDGSRVVDAEALRLVCLHVAGR